MDAVLAQRRLVAQQIAREFTSHPSVASIIVFGSVATGIVDEYSDVDMLVICQPEIIPYALNDVFDPADRRASTAVWPLLKLAPVDFARRLTVILEGPFDSAGMRLRAQQYHELVQEVIRL